MKKTIIALAAAVLLVPAGGAWGAGKHKETFGLPPEIAAEVRVYCAKVFPSSYDLQITCIEDEATAYKKLNGED